MGKLAWVVSTQDTSLANVPIGVVVGHMGTPLANARTNRVGLCPDGKPVRQCSPPPLLREQQQVLFLQFLEPCPTLLLMTSPPPPLCRSKCRCRVGVVYMK